MIQKYKWSLIRWSAGFLGLYLRRRLRKRRNHRPIDIVLIDALMCSFLQQPNVQSFSLEDRVRYESVISNTLYWHGTGRLQHDKNGGVADVLHLLAEQSGLRPFKDIFDVKQGEMESASVARARMYARIYADMHAFGGAPLDERYGSPRFWAYYFLMASFLHAVGELRLWHPRIRKAQENMWREQGKQAWTIKVTKRQDGSSVGQFFNVGSDIPNNYPILIGIRRSNYSVLETAAYVARYENRIGSTISMSAFTHMEVPVARVAEVTELLRKYRYHDLPVFAFEQCEKWWAGQPFSRLVGEGPTEKT